ncbi:MAG: HlyC/CorC family transporter [Firmicutes bacterium]|nr:HlyC/CorC family transporter [Bacillota bacterium]
MTTAFLSAGLLICIVLSSFFSGSEMSYSASSRIRMENLMEAGNRRAARAFKILEHFDDALGAILTGNNLVNIAASSIGSVLVIDLLGSGYAWISTVVVTILVIIFGETIPKIRAKKRANTLALRYSGPVSALMTVLKPFVFIVVKAVNAVTGELKGEDLEVDEDEAAEEAIDELQTIIETAENEDVLDEDQSELVQAAIDFLDASAYEAMTSRVDVEAIDIEDSRDDILNVIMQDSAFSRIPVYEGSIDNIIGILYLNRFLKAYTESDDIDIRSLLMDPVYVYKTTKLTSVLDQLRAEKQHMAVVCDEYGGTLGIITMEDILEEIVGDIWDEEDEIEEDEIKEISETVFELDGDITIDDLCEITGLPEDEFESDSDTAGGWALEHFETYPENGDSFEDEGLKVTILQIADRRVERLLVEIMPDDIQEDKE